MYIKQVFHKLINSNSKYKNKMYICFLFYSKSLLPEKHYSFITKIYDFCSYFVSFLAIVQIFKYSTMISKKQLSPYLAFLKVYRIPKIILRVILISFILKKKFQQNKFQEIVYYWLL